jgi:ferredoxin
MPRYEIRIDNTGETYACADTRTLLEGMEALARRGIPVGCRGGGCGICKVRIEAGAVRTEKMSRCHVSVDDEAAGVVLACRAYPMSDVQLRALDTMARCVERGCTDSFLDAARRAQRPTL